MAKIPDKIETWQMVEPGKLTRVSIDVPQLKSGEVLVEIAGCGVILSRHELATDRIAEHVAQRERSWDRSAITPAMRSGRLNQRSTLVLICGPVETEKVKLAKALEEDLFESGRMVYYLGLSNSLMGMNLDIQEVGQRDEYIRRLGEISHLFTDAGMILITTISDLDEYELEMLEKLNRPNEYLVVNLGENRFVSREPDLVIDEEVDSLSMIAEIKDLLQKKNYIMEYYL